MNELGLFLAVAAVAFWGSKRFRIPVIPLLLIAGLSLSLSGLAHSNETSNAILELGLTFLVFSAGVEMNPVRFRQQIQPILWVGILQFAGMTILGYALAKFLGYSRSEAIFLGFSLSASSTLLVVRELQMRRQMFEPFGRLVLGVLLLQDVLMAAVVILLYNLPNGKWAMGTGLGSFIILGGFAWLFNDKWTRFLVRQFQHNEELKLLGVLSIFFAFTTVSWILDLPMVAGAILAGFSLSRFPLNGEVRGQISTLSNFFLAIFFVALGAKAEWPNLTTGVHVLLFSGLVIFLTPPLVTFIAELMGLPTRQSLESGLILAQTSEFSLILGFAGLVTNQVNPDVFSILVLVTIITMTISPFISTDRATRWLLRFHPSREQWTTNTNRRDHILVLGFGVSGMWSVKPLLDANLPVFVVEDDPVVLRQLATRGIPHMRGDGSDFKVLKAAGAQRARLIISAMRHVEDTRKVLEFSREIPVLVRVNEDFEVEEIKKLGGIPVSNSEAAAETFLKWYQRTLKPKVTKTSRSLDTEFFDETDLK